MPVKQYYTALMIYRPFRCHLCSARVPSG